MIKPKTKEEVEIMREGGQKLARVKEVLRGMVVPGAIPEELDKKAEELVYEAGGKPSFKMVPGYNWTICLNINDGVVHGIPGKTPIRKGDIVSIDVGIFYKGFHTDSAFTMFVGQVDLSTGKFLEVGQKALDAAIKNVVSGKRISDISAAMQQVIEKAGYYPVRALTGHGVGRKLHEEPAIPCFWEGGGEDSDKIPEGAVLAVEAIYTRGQPELVLEPDGWTISTKNGKIAALFEESVAVVDGRPVILTA